MNAALSSPLVADAGLTALAASLESMASAGHAQSEAMLALARSTAESVRLSAGVYVFQLRDRFDEMLPAMQVGASESSWEVDEFPDAFAQVVFHPGDQATANLRIALSQANVRRVVRAWWTTIPAGCGAAELEVAAATLHRDTDGTIHLDNDVSLFIDAPLVVAVGDQEPGPFERTGVLRIETSDARPEGAIGWIDVNVTLSAVIVTDDDGIGVDAARIEATVLPERRTYWLDKHEHLPLQLPKLG